LTKKACATAEAGLSAAFPALALQACSAPAPTLTPEELDDLARDVTDAVSTDALMTFSAAITDHVRPSGGPGENAAIDTIAAMLVLALALHEVRDRLRHGLRVAWWPGHSNARYAGST